MHTAREFNFDGLVGPSHNYAGLSFGNVASFSNVKSASNPKQAALQGLAKMRALAGKYGMADSYFAMAEAVKAPGKMARRAGGTSELRNGWLTVRADPGILFDLPIEERFVAAMNLLGIDPNMLTGEAGHA